VGRNANGLRVDITATASPAIFELSIESSDEGQRKLAHTTLNELIKNLSEQTIPEWLTVFCSVALVTKLITHEYVEDHFELYASPNEKDDQDVIPVEVDTEELRANGIQLDPATANIWICKRLYQSALSFPRWGKKSVSNLTECKVELQKELTETHPLFSLANELKCVWQSSSNDDVLFFRPAAQSYHIVHLTWTGKAEQTGFPLWSSYKNLEAWVESALVRRSDL
jgi:hypothetical protein